MSETVRERVAILKGLLAGTSENRLAGMLGMPAAEVLSVAQWGGWPVESRMRERLEELSKDLPPTPKTPCPVRDDEPPATRPTAQPDDDGAATDDEEPADFDEDDEDVSEEVCDTVEPAQPPAVGPTSKCVPQQQIGELLVAATSSDRKRTRALASKIEALLVDLRSRVVEERQERESRERAQREAAKHRARIAELEAEIARERAALNGHRTPAGSGPGSAAPANLPAGRVYPNIPHGDFPCPDCDLHFTTPQARGSHRAHKHGHRRGEA